jgi:cytochrome c oxidase subunit 2
VRKSLIIQLLLMCVVIGAISALVALFIPWLPDLGSVEGGRIDDAYLLAAIICLVVFAIVAAVGLYAVLKFRARPGDDEDGKPIHGHTTLEVVWTAIPAALVTAIAVFSGVVLVKNEDLQSDHQVIEVKAVQFTWSFTYPDAEVTSGVLHVPVGEQIEFQLESDDVIHSFWVPEWRLKQDLVPGNPQRVIITPDQIGTFPLVCTELCGLGHSTMRAVVVAESRADFDKWLAEQKAAAGGGEAFDAAAAFNQDCGSCHTLAAAGSTGQVGPDLDKVLASLSGEEILQAIVDPNAVITEGYQGDVMPQNFGELFSEAQLDALVQYLQGATTG